VRLYLLRHARAEVGSDRLPDHGRALSPEGRQEMVDVGAWLSRRNEPPDRIVCSSSRRAVETMQCLLGALRVKPTTWISDDLYLASAWKLFEQVRATEAGVRSLMLVGHNPGIAELASRLAARGDAAALRSLSRRFPPATLAEPELAGSSWVSLEPDAGTLISHFIA
jgi:phosphohistidine phosphatase